MIRASRFALFVLLSSTLSALASAQDWPHWRGPAFNGSSTATGLPATFSPTENVKWSVELPGPSASTPIIWKDLVFVSSLDLEKEDFAAICLDRRTGAVRWKHHVHSGYTPSGARRLFKDNRSNFASPSPVTDGKVVVFSYGNGDMVCFDLEGKRLWSRNLQQDLGDFAVLWTYSSSPTIFENRLYVQVLHSDPKNGGRPDRAGGPSWLLALEPATGKELWRVERPTNARMESQEAYTTPIPVVHNGRKEILLVGGDVLTGHDPATGKELWRWSTYNPDHREQWWRLVPSAVVGDGVVLVCAPKRAPVYAVSLGASGTLTQAAWTSEERSPITSDVPTPLFYKGRFYVLSDVRRALSCVDPKTGNTLWTTTLPGTAMCWASPTGADGRIYLLNLDGLAIVVDAETGKVIHQVPMATDEQEIRSTIAAAHGNLFLRTNTRLYCIGK